MKLNLKKGKLYRFKQSCIDNYNNRLWDPVYWVWDDVRQDRVSWVQVAEKNKMENPFVFLELIRPLHLKVLTVNGFVGRLEFTSSVDYELIEEVDGS